ASGRAEHHQDDDRDDKRVLESRYDNRARLDEECLDAAEIAAPEGSSHKAAAATPIDDPKEHHRAVGDDRCDDPRLIESVTGRRNEDEAAQRDDCPAAATQPGVEDVRQFEEMSQAVWLDGPPAKLRQHVRP